MKTFNWLLISLLVLLSCSTTSTAPTPKATIQGQVFLAKYNGTLIHPIIGASVFTNPPTTIAKTDSQARFLIDVPPGHYTLRASNHNDSSKTMDTSIAIDTVTAASGRVDTANLFFEMIYSSVCKELQSEISDAVGCDTATFTPIITPTSDTTKN